MIATDWKAIPEMLNAAGFAVYYNRISYDPQNPLWRANAHRGELEWITFGRDLETALVELEKQTRINSVNWRAIVPLERGEPATATASPYAGEGEP